MVKYRNINGQPLLHALDPKTGHIVSINQVQSHHTHLICPSAECEQPVSAVINTQRTIKHFRHKADLSGNDGECKNPVGALESAVHKLSKKVIIKRGNIYITRYSKPFNRYRGERISPIFTGRFKDREQTKVELTDIEPEVRRTASASDYQPDITATLDGELFIIEIHYKHKVSDDKLDKIIRDDIPAVEISLGHLKNEDISEYKIDKALIDPKNIKWLHFPERWISDEDKLDINEYIKNEMIRIDNEHFAKERLIKEHEQQKLIARERLIKEQTVRDANRYVSRFNELIESYLKHILKEKKITPFISSDRVKLKQAFVTIDQVNNILTESCNEINPLYFDIPSSDTYKEIMALIGDAYRDKIVSSFMNCNPTFREIHLLSLYELGWHEISVNNILEFEKMEKMIKTSGYSSEIAKNIEIVEYICSTLIPDVRGMFDLYIYDFY